MKKIVKLLTLIGFSLIIILSSCNSNKHTTSYRGIAKTKNGRFVKYKKQNPNKKFLAFKSKKNVRKTDSKTKIEQPTQNMTNIEGKDILIADNSESNYQIYLKKDKVSKSTSYVDPILEDELLYEKIKTKKSKGRIFKYKQAENSLSEPSKNDDAKIDLISLIGFILSITAFGAVLLATILGGAVFLLGLALGISAIILGSIGLRRIKKSYGTLKGKGFSLAAIIIGSVFFAAITFFL